MEIDPSSGGSSSLSGNPVPKRRYTPRGACYLRVSAARWRNRYWPEGVEELLGRLPSSRHRKAAGHKLSAAERAVLLVLLQHAPFRFSKQQTPEASIKWIAQRLGASPQAMGVVLRRLGLCRAVVNLGFGKCLDLAVNMELETWNLEFLGELRAADSLQKSGNRAPK